MDTERPEKGGRDSSQNALPWEPFQAYYSTLHRGVGQCAYTAAASAGKGGAGFQQDRF